MKSNLNRSITVIMAFLVLLSSTGFAFVEHQCMMRGKSVQLVSEKKPDSCEKKVVSSCCAKAKQLKESKGTFLKKTDCCKDSQKFEKIDVVSSANQAIAKLLKVWAGDFVWAATSYSFIRAEWTLPSSEPASPDISFSSRLHGRSMLSFIQSFLI
ncbi:HYC_CC_PP family protein [Dyadobacter pollutisoli]|uniref:Uncharacterized protein n=1 Tax=Dyadobacter pollutisoli TaxID=2910158 RepID=A0A9E8N9C5_9BACT|nr:hypothetical protein [Dyadobacter pollutisoli]WAC10269.1 hypothetical protein ON006_21220 [Dyadobacter pollutisoli]